MDDLDFLQRSKALEVAGEWLRGRSSNPADVVKSAYVFLHFLRGTAKSQAKPAPADEAEEVRDELRALGIDRAALPAHLDKPVADMTPEDKAEIREWARNVSVLELAGHERPRPILREVPKPAEPKSNGRPRRYDPEFVDRVRREVAELREKTGRMPRGSMPRLEEKFGLPRATIQAIADGRVGGPIRGSAA